MGLDARTPVFEVFDKASFKPVSYVTFHKANSKGAYQTAPVHVLFATPTTGFLVSGSMMYTMIY